MYKKKVKIQPSVFEFNQPMGLKLDMNNRWVKRAAAIPWDELEEEYARLFPGFNGMPAKPFRMALGALLIQKFLGVSDREVVQQIRENPYLQYFIGLDEFQYDDPFTPSLMVSFRKRITAELLEEINEKIIRYSKDDDDERYDDDQGSSDDTGSGSSKDDSEAEENSGTMMLDATCSPQYIAYPLDTRILNEAREGLEKVIDRICADNGISKPRTYRRKARTDYLNIAKSKRPARKKIRKSIKLQLQYIRRDLRYIDEYLEAGIMLKEKDLARYLVIKEVYRQQKHMYDKRTHTVEERIVSISQPYVRPIVRGKANAAVEFGAKLDISVDEEGFVRIERLSYDAYNESEVLIEALERYHARTGHYPERVLADKIYRNKLNIQYCKERQIRLLGPALGRPRKESEEDRRRSYKDNTDRIEVERRFSVAKRCYGLGCIMTRLEETSKSSINLTTLAMNIDHIVSIFLRLIIRQFGSKYFLVGCSA